MIYYYYGVWAGDKSGHGLHYPNGRIVAAENNYSPWTVDELDENWLSDEIGGEKQPQGIATLSHKGGWTALAFWDRSGDDRFESRSVFVAEGTLTFVKLLSICSDQFPDIINRIGQSYSIQLWNRALKQASLPQTLGDSKQPALR